MTINDLQLPKAGRKGDKVDMTFAGVQEAFESLKKKFQDAEISRQAFIDEMKKLRLKDDQGRFWMIGAQSGKWYYFDGKDWIQDEPPSQKDQRAICVYCGFENKLTAETCGRCGGTMGDEPTSCPSCGSPLEKPFLTCPKCSKGPEISPAFESIRSIAAEDRGRIVLRGVEPLSVTLLGGLAGIVLGVILGVFAGATRVFDIGFMPGFFVEQQGKLLGALFMGLLGGVSGFLSLAAAAFLGAIFLNIALPVIGGLKLTVGAVPPVPIETGEAEPKPRDDGGLGFNLKD